MPMVAERPAFYQQHGKEPALEQMRTKPSYQLFVGVDTLPTGHLLRPPLLQERSPNASRKRTLSPRKILNAFKSGFRNRGSSQPLSWS